MAKLTLAQLKEKWITGYIPTQSDFADLFDTIFTQLSSGLDRNNNIVYGPEPSESDIELSSLSLVGKGWEVHINS